MNACQFFIAPVDVSSLGLERGHFLSIMAGVKTLSWLQKHRSWQRRKQSEQERLERLWIRRAQANNSRFRRMIAHIEDLEPQQPCKAVRCGHACHGQHCVAQGGPFTIRSAGSYLE